MKKLVFAISAIVLFFLACSQIEKNKTEASTTISTSIADSTTAANRPYTYSWQHNLDSEYKFKPNQQGLQTGSYVVNVSDANGASALPPSGTFTMGRIDQDIPVSNYDEKLIKRAYMSIQVKDYTEAMASIRHIASEQGGTITGENERHLETGITNSVVIRIPNKKFESTVEGVDGVAKKVDYKTIQTTDVTEEFVDLQARIKSKKEVEKRYFEILGNARTTKDILAVENQLRVIREEIEAKEGRLAYLKDRVGFSTINLEVYTKVKQATVLAKKEKEPEFSDQLKSSLTAGWNGVLGSFLDASANWPTLIILVIGFFITRKIYKKLNGKTA